MGVWARQVGSSISYESYFVGTYQLAVVGCTSAGLSAGLPSPQPAGTRVTFTATSAGCAAPLYEFWGQAPGRPWRVIQSYSSASTFTWNSAGSPKGNYNVAVWATATASASDYDQYALTPFALS